MKKRTHKKATRRPATARAGAKGKIAKTALFTPGLGITKANWSKLETYANKYGKDPVKVLNGIVKGFNAVVS